MFKFDALNFEQSDNRVKILLDLLIDFFQERLNS